MTNRWTALPAPRPLARVRLFCFPHAGSGIAQFQRWVDLLPADVELCPVRLPGRESRLREPPFTRIDQLVDSLVDNLPLEDRPFVLFGHSMGASVAFALAVRLQQTGRQGPTHVFVSGRRAAHLPDSEPPIHGLPEQEFITELRRRYGEASVALLHDADLRAIFLPVLRADLRVVESYEHVAGYQLTCPLTALGGIDDPRATLEQLDAWREHTSAEFTLKRFPGGHFYLHSAGAQLVQEISRGLAVDRYS